MRISAVKNSQYSMSNMTDETSTPNKAPTKADLMEIRSLYAQADAMIEATEKPEKRDEQGDTA